MRHHASAAYVDCLIVKKVSAADVCTVLLNENTVFEYILQDDIIYGVTSILEYDPEFPQMKASYTAHLSDPSRFREVVPIKDATIKTKIHQIYRLQYLKDVVLARILDDATFSMLNSFIYFHQVDIVTHLQNNVAFLSQLFGIFGVAYGSLAALKDAPSPPSPAPKDRQRQALLFLQQFCAMAKNLQVACRNTFYRAVAEKGLLRVIEYSLANPPFDGKTEANGMTPREDATRAEEHDVRGATVEILMTLIEHDPASVRGHSLRQHEAKADSRTLMRFIIDLFHSEPDLGIKAQFAEAIRVLVQAQPEAGSVEAMQARGRADDPEVDKFLQYFYDHCVEVLVKPLLDLPDPDQQPGASSLLRLELLLTNALDGLLDLSREQSTLCAHLCDHLCYFVAAHAFRSVRRSILTWSPSSNARTGPNSSSSLPTSTLRSLDSCGLSRSTSDYVRSLILAEQRS